MLCSFLNVHKGIIMTKCIGVCIAEHEYNEEEEGSESRGTGTLVAKYEQEIYKIQSSHTESHLLIVTETEGTSSGQEQNADGYSGTSICRHL